MTPTDPVPPAGTVTGDGGVPIRYWSTGGGPVVVLVHGTTSDHTTFTELVPHLAAVRTVVTYDRRGRGRSGDGPDYRVEQEFADAAAVLAVAAAVQGGPVDVVSHSFGCYLALGAASVSPHVRSVVAYSPGFGGAYPAGTVQRIESATASDDPDSALRVVFREVIGMPEDEIAFLRASPVWATRVAAAGTVARECRADEAFLRTHGDRLRRLAVPVLVVDGGANTDDKRAVAGALAARLSRAALTVIQGQGHVAHHAAPWELAGICLRFFANPDAAVGSGGPVAAAAAPPVAETGRA